ncbi:MAG: ABC transporter ATP-binding protein [Anaerolineales bacterium]
MEDLITCENLVKIYQLDGVEVMALQGLDLHVRRGEMVGIIGASGSGKTTLLNVLGGLDRPSAGKVRVEAYDLLKLSESQLDLYRRKMVGFLWQQTSRNLLPYLTALENVTLPMWLAGRPRSDRLSRAHDLLSALGLIDRIHHLPLQLSGGEQQRVALAVALANQPALLLADEPTGEVDSATAKEVYTALNKMNETQDLTTIIVSHDPQLNRYTDRVVTIRDGKTSSERIRAVAEINHQDPESHGARQLDEETIGQVKSSALSDSGGSFEELLVLDSAGRLQIPKKILETLDIGDRVRLEVSGKSVLLHPVSGRSRKMNKIDNSQQQEELYLQEDQEPDRRKPSGIKRIMPALKRSTISKKFKGWWKHRLPDGR